MYFMTALDFKAHSNLISFSFLTEDLAFVRHGKLFKLAGGVNLGRQYENMKVLTIGILCLHI